MPWYKTGTVSVTQNSRVVTGTGVAFAVNCRVGDAFRGPDGEWYEVIDRFSDTSISIDPPYQGATTAAGVYALAPMQGYVKDLADAFRLLINQFGGLLAVLGNDPTQAGVRSALGLTNTDGVPEGPGNKYFTSARAIAAPLSGLDTSNNSTVVSTDTLLSAVGKLQAQATSTGLVAQAALPKSGGALTGPINDAPIQTLASAATVNIGAATSNVVTISGTTTIASFGTIAAGARRTVRFLGSLILTYNAAALILPTSNNIVTAANDTAEFLSLGGGSWICLRYDAVSGKSLAFSYDKTNAIGLVANGAIIESGSSGSGYWMKFADGSMETRHRGSISLNITTAYGALYYGAAVAIAFPQTFVGDLPEMTLQVSGGPVAALFVGRQTVVTATDTGPFIVMAPAPLTNAVMTVDIVAKGRWKV